jgi:hypothetical protein
MIIQIGKTPIIEAIFKAAFDEQVFQDILPRARLLEISKAGKIADGLLAADPLTKLEFKVSD